MPKRYHEIKISFIVHATEDESRVIRAVEELLGGPLPEDTQVIDSEGVFHNPIRYFTVSIKRSGDIRRLILKWSEMDFWKEALADIRDRLDDDLVYHLRIDKEKAFQGVIALWKGGESIDIRLKTATFPSSREAAMSIIKNGP